MGVPMAPSALDSESCCVHLAPWGQHESTSPQPCRIRAGFARELAETGPNLSGIWSGSAEFAADLVKPGPIRSEEELALAKRRPKLPELGLYRADKL